MAELTSTTPYQSGGTRARAVTILLALGILASVVAMVSSYMQVDLISDVAGGEAVSDERAESNDLRELVVAGFELLVFIPTVVLFCMWFYRAHKNLVALGNPRHSLDSSSGWAVGSFFIPIVNLFLPYRAAREIWVKSDPTVSEEGMFFPNDRSAPAVMKLWWAFWIGSNILNNLAFRMGNRADTPGEMLNVTWIDLAANILEIPAAVFAILVVRGIDERQERRSKLVTYVENIPPPPPIMPPPPARQHSATPPAQEQQQHSVTPPPPATPSGEQS